MKTERLTIHNVERNQGVLVPGVSRSGRMGWCSQTPSRNKTDRQSGAWAKEIKIGQSNTGGKNELLERLAKPNQLGEATIKVTAREPIP
jgi:hypothetical protein